jgi:hypothetical protein
VAKVSIEYVQFHRVGGEPIKSASAASRSFVAVGKEWREWTAYLAASNLEFHKDKDGQGQPLPPDAPVEVVLVPRSACTIRGRKEA